MYIWIVQVICVNIKMLSTHVNLPLSLRFRKSFDDPFQTGGVSESIWFNSYDIRYQDTD